MTDRQGKWRITGKSSGNDCWGFPKTKHQMIITKRSTRYARCGKLFLREPTVTSSSYRLERRYKKEVSGIEINHKRGGDFDKLTVQKLVHEGLNKLPASYNCNYRFRPICQSRKALKENTDDWLRWSYTG